MKKLLIAGLAFAVLGCATIMQGSKQEVGVSSSPTNAEVSINGQNMGNTPLAVKLARKDTQLIRVDLDGYQPHEIKLTRKVSGWIAGNIIFGGIPGLIIDAITGAMYILSPDQVQAQLRDGRAGLIDNRKQMYIMVVLEPDPNWQKIGTLTSR